MWRVLFLFFIPVLAQAGSLPSSACADSLAAPISIEEARLWRKFNASLRWPSTGPSGFRARWAALEYRHAHPEEVASRDSLYFFDALDRVAKGSFSVLQAEIQAPDLRFSRMIEQSRFLQRMARESQPIPAQEKLATQRKSTRVQRLLWYFDVKREEIDRWDVLLARLAQYSDLKQRASYYRAHFAQIGPITWLEMQQVLTLFSEDYWPEIMRASLPQIFTPATFYSDSVRGEAEDLERLANYIF